MERFWKDFRALWKLSSKLSGLCFGSPSATFVQTPTHATKTQDTHRRNTPDQRNTPETQEGDGRTNGETRQSYGRNTPQTQEEHAGKPALSAERGRGARPRSYTRVSGDAVKLHA